MRKEQVDERGKALPNAGWLEGLFHTCNMIDYETVGDDVSYRFVEAGDSLTIYFQGSNSITDWIRNFLFKKRPYKDMEIPYRVHRGFLAAWKEVEDTVIAKVTETTPILTTAGKEENCVRVFKWKSVVVVGYSHGGALSGLCHECVWYHRPDLRGGGLFGVGFESPRFFGGFRVPEKLRERWADYFVVKTNEDIVTHCPPWVLGYRHVGTVLGAKGDTSLVKNRLPKCVKSHYPQTVEDGLLKIAVGKEEWRG